MLFGPQKLIIDYSRKKVIPLGAVVTSAAEAAVLKSCVLNRMDRGHCARAFR